MKIAIIGSRAAKPEHMEKLEKELDALDVVGGYWINLETGEVPPVTIISGGAQGADALGKAYAERTGCAYKEYKPNWTAYGKAAGQVRNRKIIERADIVLALWDGRSKGTAGALRHAKRLNKRVRVVVI